MKKKVFITTLIIFILMCIIIGVLIFISPKNNEDTLAKDNNINENTIDILNNTISNEESSEISTTVAESYMTTEPEKEIQKEDNTLVEKNTNQSSSKTSIISNDKPTNKNTQKTTQTNENTTSKSTTSSSNVENTKTQETTKPVDTPTETKPVTQPTRCTNNNNHGLDVGNCERWFNSKNEAISYYEKEIEYWGDLWEKGEENGGIDDNEYFKNCPAGYEIWSCMYCSKWTINFYYR